MLKAILRLHAIAAIACAALVATAAATDAPQHHGETRRSLSLLPRSPSPCSAAAAAVCYTHACTHADRRGLGTGRPRWPTGHNSLATLHSSLLSPSFTLVAQPLTPPAVFLFSLCPRRPPQRYAAQDAAAAPAAARKRLAALPSTRFCFRCVPPPLALSLRPASKRPPLLRISGDGHKSPALRSACACLSRTDGQRWRHS